jgi:hypothetical protein
MRRAVVPVLGALVACGGEPITTELQEPLSVEGAQFREGPLPGASPLTAEELNQGAEPVAPYPTPPDVAGRIVTPSEVGFTVSGRASTDAYAVGFQLSGLGSGYWLVPVGAPDPSNGNELLWNAILNFGGSLEPGRRGLLVAAVDGQGRAGTQRELELCVRAPVTDNLNACDPTVAPPALVVSLGWQNEADLDLVIVAADGSLVDQANTRGNGGGTTGVQLERDANGGCLPSGAPRENLFWQDSPPPGVYSIYVNLHDACGELAAPFIVTAHLREQDGDQYRQIETFRIAGEAVSLQANGGRARGLWVTDLSVD